ncbi:Calx-beta domain-containing protein, partial [uncultured Gimesia sp.]|uniref:Calx-beta domain-containing protein n=1 Tax=uncultured Gimesia sp. TaxID=1678688 RepID=UPI0030DD3FF1
MLTSILNIDDVSIVEGDAGTTDVMITVTRTGTVAGDLNSVVMVDFNTIDGTATSADSDYVTQTDTISFLEEASALTQTQTITIQVNSDLITEEDETFGIQLSNNSLNTTLGDDSATVTILNDDQSTLSINDITVNEADGTASVMVSLDHPLDAAVSFDFSVFDETANDSTDYISNSGSLSFAPGEQEISITINIVDSDLVESTETFLVLLSNIQTTSSSLLTPDTLAKVRILDDDQASLSIDDVSLDEDGVSATIIVSLDKPVDTEISVDFLTADQTATSADDYSATSGILTFSAEVLSQMITVPIADNNIVELDETFLINLFNLRANDADVIIGDDQATVTIQNDEQAQISISDIIVNENMSTAVLIVSLDHPVDADVSFNFATNDSSAEDITDYLATSGTLTFTPGMQSIEIPVSLVDSELVELDESFLVDLTNIQANGRDVVFANIQAEITIQDDQQSHLTIDNITVTEDDMSGIAILTVSLDRPVDTTISIDYTTNDLTAFNTADYTTMSGTLIFAAGEQSKTIMVSLINDSNLVEGEESFVVDLMNLQANGANVMITANQATVTILDDEQATISIDDISIDENAPSGMAVLTVSLDQPVTTIVTVDYATADNSAFDLDDYTAQTGALSFSVGVQTQTIMIPIIDDIDIVEGVESFLVNLTGILANGANITFADNLGAVTILDDETATVSIDDISIDENDSSGMAVLTVSLSQALATTVTIDYATADNTSIDSEDYTAKTDTLTFAPGITTQTIMIPIIDDMDIVEGDESFFVNLSNILANGANISFADDQGEVTILDDEAATISIDNVSVNENNGTATLTVSLDQPVATTVTVDFATADQLALDGDDYTAQSGTLTFTPGAQTQSIVINISNDIDIVEGDESFLVNLTGIQANGANISFNNDQGEVTIHDNETATISINDVSVEEHEGTATLTVTLDQPVQTDVSFEFATSDQTALNPGDYTTLTNTFSFTAGQQLLQINVLIIDDNLVEGTETLLANLTNILANGANITFTDAEGEITIQDNDASSISIDDVSINEDLGTTTITVSRNKLVDRAVSVDYATSNDLALDPEDYTSTSGTLTFADDEFSKTITVPVMIDDLVEDDESFFVNLTNLQANGADVNIGDNQGTVTILNDDQATISINDFTVNENGGTATLTVSLDQPVATTVTVDFSTDDLSAFDLDDYTAQTGTLTFASGVQTQTIIIDITDDLDTVEGDESFVVNLTDLQANGLNVIMGNNQGTVTIHDNESATISISDETVNEGDGTVTLTVSIDKPVKTTVNVDYTTADLTAFSSVDYTAMSGTLSFAPDQQTSTITIPITNDMDLVEVVEHFSVSLSNIQANGANLTFLDNQADVSIEDNDQASFSIDNVSIDEEESSATISVSLDKAVDTAISVDYATSDQTATSVDDYSVSSGTLTFVAGVQLLMITVPITDNNIVELDETFLITLTSLQANGADVIIGDNQATVTILNNDQATISITNISEDENSGTATLTVSLDQPVATTVTVDFATADLSAIAPTDYTAQMGTLTFNPEVQTQTIIITLIDNELVEGDRTFQVSLSNLQNDGYDVSMGVGQATVTILDDDQATISINDISISEDGVIALIDVTLDKPVEETVTVEYATADQTAFDLSDYTATTGMLTFFAGEQSHQIMVPIIDNMIVEGDETFLINLSDILSNGTNVIFADNQAEVTILDNEQASFSIDDMIVNEDAGTATLTVSLNLVVDTDISVDVTTFNLTAGSPDDYTAKTQTLEFFSGDLMKPITIDILDDDLVEDDESLLVLLSNIQNGANVTFADSQGTILIQDNDEASLSIQDTTVNEMEGTVSVTVSLDKPVDTTISVDYFTTPDSALDPDDFTSQSDTFTFNPGEQTKTITIPLTDDLDIVEGDETFLINLINLVPNGAAVTIGDNQATVTILDDETATISIDNITVNEDDISGMAILTVSLDQPVATTVTVDYTTADLTALNTTDYSTMSGTLTFNPGEQSKTIMVPLINDLDIVEGIESFFVNLSNIQANGANITFVDDQGEVTIEDDEVANISIDDMTVNENGVTATLTVSLDQPITTTVTVDYATQDQLALDPEDYTAQTGTLTFDPDIQTQTIVIDIINDLDIVEGIESFFVNLSNIQANGANI